ncbi:hypothetical protein CIK52_01640 [Kocuria rosea]|uniref:hypothetical protein n=1 Tax=Kocuria rosea TaxID=1275 RepID=UPI000D644F5A|nr:hypothetical protein [Kocuria rosea]PWF88027.1 hypothetical protein CIK52_01640 [Kocuria rosea]QCY32629.1 hypothetical protein EQG70_06820 [Kocuria rosea]TQN34682.1 hypothetical protein FHX38_2786 [Kocuria rosea]
MTPHIETFPAPGGMVRARLDGVPFTAELIRALPVRAVARPDLLDATPLLSVTTSRVYAWTSLEAGRRTTTTSPAVGEWIAADPAGRLVLVVALSLPPQRWGTSLPHLAYEARPHLSTDTVIAVPVRAA